VPVKCLDNCRLLGEAVETELAFDPLVESSDVSVKNLEREVPPTAMARFRDDSFRW
jgi:hypothetical protein